MPDMTPDPVDAEAIELLKALRRLCDAVTQWLQTATDDLDESD